MGDFTFQYITKKPKNVDFQRFPAISKTGDERIEGLGRFLSLSCKYRKMGIF